MLYIQEVEARSNIRTTESVVVAYVRNEDKIVYVEGNGVSDELIDDEVGEAW